MRVHEIDIEKGSFEIMSSDANFSVFISDRTDKPFDRIVADRSLDKFYSHYHKNVNAIRDNAERTEALNWAYDNLDAISVNYHFTFSDDAKMASADTGTLVNEYFFNAVTGKISIEDTWDQYVADWYAKGGDVLTREANDQL